MRGLVSCPPLEWAVRQLPWSLRLLLPRRMTPPKHCSPYKRHPRLITLMPPQRPKLQTRLQKPKMMFSPKATASLTKFMDMSDDEEGTLQKRHGGSTNREVPFKKAKVDDDSDSYSSPTPSKSDVPKMEVKKRKTKKKIPSSDDESSYASTEERATPKKSSRDEKAKQIAWTNRDHASKWKKDPVFVDRYQPMKRAMCQGNGWQPQQHSPCRSVDPTHGRRATRPKHCSH